MKKVLILSTSTGYGHDQAANSLKELIKNNNTEIVIHDFLKDNRLFNSSIINGYELCARFLGNIYGFFYRLINFNSINNIISVFFLPVSKKLAKYILDFNPDVIISTHPLAINILSYLKKKKLINVPIISIVTDFECHATYVSKEVDQYIVASQYTKKSLVSKGIDENKIAPFGIPVRQNFYEHDYHKYIPHILDGPIKILLMGGGMGLNNISKVLKKLSEGNIPLELTVVCGKNNKLKNHLLKEYNNFKGNKKINILGYTTNIPEIMKNSDLIITKPGGLTTTESLLSQLPMIIPFIIPGQESENRDFLAQNNCAIPIRNLDELNIELSKFESDKDKLMNMKKSILKVLEPYSHEDIVNLCNKIIDNSYKKRRY